MTIKRDNMDTKNTVTFNCGCASIVFGITALLAGLKLVGVLNLDWLWVLSPIWGCMLLGVGITVVSLIITAFAMLLLGIIAFFSFIAEFVE